MGTEAPIDKKTSRNADHLNNYYGVNCSHLKWSFWASITALCIGLSSILAGVWFVLTGNQSLTSSLATIGGVLTQFIGAGFFFLYTKNLKQLNLFYEKLIKLQDTEHAIALIGFLPVEAREKQINMIINMLITRNEPKLDLNPEMLKAMQEYSKSQSS